LKSLPDKRFSGFPILLGEIEAAGLVAPAGIRRVRQDSPVIAGIKPPMEDLKQARITPLIAA